MSLYVSNILVLANQSHPLCHLLLILRPLFNDCDNLDLHLVGDLLLCFQTLSRCLIAVVDELKLLFDQVAILAFYLLTGFLVSGPLALGLHLFS